VAFKGQLEQNFVVLHDKFYHEMVEKPKNPLISQVANESNLDSP
jgi:hypothetical protein